MNSLSLPQNMENQSPENDTDRESADYPHRNESRQGAHTNTNYLGGVLTWILAGIGTIFTIYSYQEFPDYVYHRAALFTVAIVGVGLVLETFKFRSNTKAAPRSKPAQKSSSTRPALITSRHPVQRIKRTFSKDDTDFIRSALSAAKRDGMAYVMGHNPNDREASDFAEQLRYFLTQLGIRAEHFPDYAGNTSTNGITGVHFQFRPGEVYMRPPWIDPLRKALEQLGIETRNGTNDKCPPGGVFIEVGILLIAPV